MGELLNLQWAFGTKQRKSRPRAELQPCISCGQPDPHEQAGLWQQIKGFEWEGMSSIPGRSCLSGKAGGKVEPGGGCRCLSLSLAPPGTVSQEPWSFQGASCCPFLPGRAGGTALPVPCVGLVDIHGGSAPFISPGKDLTAAAALSSKCLQVGKSPGICFTRVKQM